MLLHWVGGERGGGGGVGGAKWVTRRLCGLSQFQRSLSHIYHTVSHSVISRYVVCINFRDLSQFDISVTHISLPAKCNSFY